MDKSDKGGGAKGPGINDLLLWKAFTHDVEPLEGTPDWAEMEGEARRSEQKNKKGGSEKVSFSTPVSKEAPQRIEDPQLDRRTEERFRKGKMQIEGRLDLHGFTQDQAHMALTNFIESAYHADKRCVIVITGKGTPRSRAEEEAQEKVFWGSGTRKGILKERVPGWLASSPLSRIVLKVAPAQPKDGGSGAFYVYLKRRR